VKNVGFNLFLPKGDGKLFSVSLLKAYWYVLQRKHFDAGLKVDSTILHFNIYADAFSTVTCQSV